MKYFALKFKTLSQLFRRRALLAAGAGAMLSMSLGATAQEAAWPTKPITFVVPFAAGGPTDVLARAIGDKLRAALGQPVIIDNKPGGNTLIASNHVRRAAPDGYTLLVISPAAATNNVLDPKLFNFHPVNDYTPIANLARVIVTIAVSNNVPARNMKEFIELARSKPGQVTWGVAGIGQVDHVNAILLAQKAGVKFNFVPYKGTGPAVQDVAGGVLDAVAGGYSAIRGLAESGQLRVLAHMEQGPVASLPNMPAVADTLPGVSFGLDQALLGPKGIPSAIVDRLNREVNAVLAMPDVAAKLSATGFESRALSPQELARTMHSEFNTYARIIKENNIKLQE